MSRFVFAECRILYGQWHLTSKLIHRIFAFETLQNLKYTCLKKRLYFFSEYFIHYKIVDFHFTKHIYGR
jgi:hypothetical protein